MSARKMARFTAGLVFLLAAVFGGAAAAQAATYETGEPTTTVYTNGETGWG
ncbi:MULTISPECIES: hypothetical protein [Actinoplanes]|uniref:hypothetical protein n=1 Tax=Actinoplanes TaxID=1865 RepID=UPI000A796B8E|nr:MULTISPECIES: hypothetical protein [Actinoplanes]GLY00801.1 hypothetical protein Acsp01_11800 [Actinoplanes sp. NBRC 101535]